MAGVGCKRSRHLLSTWPEQRSRHDTGSPNDLGNHWEQCPWTWGKGLDCPLTGGDIANLSYSLSRLRDLEGPRRHGMREL